MPMCSKDVNQARKRPSETSWISSLPLRVGESVSAMVHEGAEGSLSFSGVLGACMLEIVLLDRAQ